MTIRNYREARSLLLAVHAKRAETGNQEFFQGAEESIAYMPRIVDAELQAIARATELDSFELATPDRLDALRDRVREIMEGE